MPGRRIFMGSTLDLSCYSRDGTIVDFARLPVDVGWGRSTINPTAVAASKVIVEPVHGGRIPEEWRLSTDRVLIRLSDEIAGFNYSSQICTFCLIRDRQRL